MQFKKKTWKSQQPHPKNEKTHQFRIDDKPQLKAKSNQLFFFSFKKKFSDFLWFAYSQIQKKNCRAWSSRQRAPNFYPSHQQSEVRKEDYYSTNKQVVFSLLQWMYGKTLLTFSSGKLPPHYLIRVLPKCASSSCHSLDLQRWAQGLDHQWQKKADFHW